MTGPNWRGVTIGWGDRHLSGTPVNFPAVTGGRHCRGFADLICQLLIEPGWPPDYGAEAP
jgi:hypothetical protein